MMKKIFNCVCLSGLLIAGDVYGDRIEGKVVLDSRIVANRADVFLRLSALNATPDVITLDGNRQQDRVMIQRLDMAPDAVRLRPLDYLTGPSGVVTVPAGRTFALNLGGITTQLDMTLTKGTYGHYSWQAALVDPSPDIESVMPRDFVIGYASADGGELKPPYVEPGSGVSNLLAFVFYENMKGGFPLENVPPHEVSFLLLNGSTEPLDAKPPLSAESVLQLSAPGIGYSSIITLDNTGFQAQSIPAGECGQWRIPFERILAQIPKETVEAIRAADGALDVVWKTGDLESQPLPLILLPPTQAELDAAFLAEHADVPRIDENTDLSFDFRLAGIEQNKPVLLGWLKNNEKHAVLADEKFYHNNSLDSSFRYAPFFTKQGQRSVLFLVEPNETALLSASLESLIHDIKDTLEKESIGRMFCYEWRCLKRFSKPIWFAIYGDDADVSKIHTYADKYLPISEYHRPPLPPVAPLLAYIHNPETPPELTCVLWNRTEKSIQVADSRIIATNAALGYRRELTLPAGLDLPVAVAPGAHTDWRIPWSAIIEQIPTDDLARIEAADGKLDLVWQANDLTSPPLPLLLDWQGDAE